MPYSRPAPRYVMLGIAVTAIFLLIVSFVGAQDTTTETERPTGTYVIAYGDTLDVLAQEWDISLPALMQANNITVPYTLQPGDTIAIPADAPPYGEFPVMEALQTDTTAGQGGGGGVDGESYIVQPRDTIDTIAQEFDVSAVSLQLANNVEHPRLLQPGMTLIIPADAPPYGEFPALTDAGTEDASLGQGGGGAGTHVVQRNQTLDGIAAMYNLQTRCLQEANEIGNPRQMYPGDVITLDTSCPPYDGYDVVPESPPGA